DRRAVGRQLRHDLLGGIVVGLELGPQVGAGLEKVELDLVYHRHGVLGRAADRLASIERGALAAAVEARHRRVEAVVEGCEVVGFQRTFRGLGGHAPLYLECVLKNSEGIITPARVWSGM